MEQHVNPTSESFKAFRDLPRDEPIEMLNLIRYRALADYPADMAEAAQRLTGAQAYKLYGDLTEPCFRKVGGSVIWSATPQVMLTGPSDEHWDTAFVAHYPTAQAFLDMLRDPDYQLAVRHRTAAVLTSRLLRTLPRDGRNSFA
jgi:uncharacterized protein (DUF1330 family)